MQKEGGRERGAQALCCLQVGARSSLRVVLAFHPDSLPVQAVYCSSECQKKNWAENKTGILSPRLDSRPASLTTLRTAACKKEQQFVKLMQSSNWT